MRLEGRTALITGAGGPMGAAIAERFAEEGASLVLTDISGNRLAGTVARLEDRWGGGRVAWLRADIRNRQEAAAVVAEGLAKFEQVDLLVNVVGGIKGASLYQPLVEMDEERWDATMELNLKGSFHLLQMLAPGMVERNYGKIVNISSISFAGEIGQADYGAAKAAVASLTRTLAMELAPHVNVNCIAPGTIKTSVMDRMEPEEAERYRSRSVLKRFGEPREIANVVLFLCSDESAYVTGAILPVSGGIWPAL